jgi:hypothetical protein
MSLNFPMTFFDGSVEIASRADLDYLIDQTFDMSEVVDVITPRDFGPSDLVRILENAGYNLDNLVDTLVDLLEPYDDSDAWYMHADMDHLNYIFQDSDESESSS